MNLLDGFCIRRDVDWRWIGFTSVRSHGVKRGYSTVAWPWFLAQPSHSGVISAEVPRSVTLVEGSLTVHVHVRFFTQAPIAAFSNIIHLELNFLVAG